MAHKKAGGSSRNGRELGRSPPWCEKVRRSGSDRRQYSRASARDEVLSGLRMSASARITPFLQLQKAACDSIPANKAGSMCRSM